MDAPVTVVTGASRGIGRALVEHYLARGHQVIGCSRGDAVAETPSYTHVVADVTDESAVRQLFADVRRQFGRVDHVVNNAGVASMNHALLTPADTVRRLLDVNTVGTFVVAREAAKLMQRRRAGRIVNFTSVAVPLRLAGEAAYVASKAAIEALTKVLAQELGPFGVTVNAIGPTPVRTDLIRGVPENALDALVQRQAIARYGEMDDVVNVVDFFLDPRSSFVTGQTIYLGGVS